jgi:hypothetical protein
MPLFRVRRLSRMAAYAWAAPNSLIGLFAGALLLSFGGRARVVAGTLEVALIRSESATDRPWRFDAVTLGHVVLAHSDDALAALRPHEHAHVRQYERWGPFFLPAYAASSAWHWMRGGHAHADNHFERSARGEGG